ncbi:unnamed protein product [Cuscuta epithymum]|uniref:Uncharacterized protein n=1 Tax=Cuscuta epithymum TaxID=186058 RepID=A0AAV0CSA4_9ASTE|nr:unnamed protein product [Cuscuta epithymum]
MKETVEKPRRIPEEEEAEHGGEGEIFGVILSRSRSVSASIHLQQSAATNKADENSIFSESAAGKTSFSKRRKSVSSASGGGYCRIHHQHFIIGAEHGGGDGPQLKDSQKITEKKKKKGNRVLTACMRLLGF